MRQETVEMVLAIQDDSSDAEELDRLARQLRPRLLTVDVHSVENVPAGEAPDDTRGLPLAVIGTLLVTVAKSPELIKSVVAAVGAWASAHPTSTVAVTIGGDSITIAGRDLSPEQRQIVELWASRHSS